MSTVRVNGKQYDSGDVTVALNGTLFNEVKEISYNTEQEHQLNHSLAEEATSWSKGKITHTSSITLYMSSIVGIEKSAGGSLLSIKPFPVTVTYVNDDNEIVTDILIVKFQNQGREVTGEMGLAKQYELFTLGIKFNV